VLFGGGETTKRGRSPDLILLRCKNPFQGCFGFGLPERLDVLQTLCSNLLCVFVVVHISEVRDESFLNKLLGHGCLRPLDGVRQPPIGKLHVTLLAALSFHEVAQRRSQRGFPFFQLLHVVVVCSDLVVEGDPIANRLFELLHVFNGCGCLSVYRRVVLGFRRGVWRWCCCQVLVRFWFGRHAATNKQDEQ
jgi:hypothetical protein